MKGIQIQWIYFKHMKSRWEGNVVRSVDEELEEGVRTERLKAHHILVGNYETIK